MFWRTLGAILVSVFFVAENGVVAIHASSHHSLPLAQQKVLLEWNLERNKEVLSDNSNTEIAARLERIKKKNQRLFIEERTVTPRREIRLRISQETTHEPTEPM